LDAFRSSEHLFNYVVKDGDKLNLLYRDVNAGTVVTKMRTPLILPVLLLGFLPARGQEGPLARVQELLQAGQAKQALTIVATLDPNVRQQPLMQHLTGLAHYQLGDYLQAVTFLASSFAQAAKGTSQRIQAAQLVGMSHYFLNRFAEALPYLAELEGSPLDTAETQYVRGICQLQTQNVQEARRTFARMFAVPADSASSRLINAQMMIRQNLEELAVQELQGALALDPRLPQVRFLLGELAIYKSDLDGGIELLKQEIEINPGFAMAYYRLGEAYGRQQRWDEAIPPLQKSIWLNPFFSGPFIVLGKAYLKKGDNTNAENILKRALSMDVNNYSGHYLLAQVYQKTGRMEEARKEFQTAERLRPNSNQPQ